MTKHEQLMENYEDALLALLMEKEIEKEGEIFLKENDRLRNAAKLVTPADLDKKITRTINRAFRKQKVGKVRHFTNRVVRQAAIIALVVTLLFTTAFAASETVRAATRNFVSATFYDHMEIRLVEKDSVLPIESNSLDFEVGWLPDGFVISDSGSTWSNGWKVYTDPDGCDLGIEISLLSDAGVIAVDTEGAEIKEIRINGVDAKMIIKDYLQIVIPIDDRGQIIFVWSEGVHISAQNLVKIAESIILQAL